MLDIISIGECLVELYADEAIATAPFLYKSYGGDVLNLVVAASRLGSRTAFVTRLGRDPFAPFLLDAWTREGVDVSRTRLIEGHNGLYVISLLPGGEREIAYYRTGSAASTLTAQDLDATFLRSAKIVHTSGITQALSPSCRAVVREAVALAHERGPLVSYDPNLRPQLWPIADARAALGEVLPYLDVILPSAPDETFALIDLTEPEEIVEYFWSHGIKIVAVKLGRDGCLVGVNGELTEVPAYRAGPAVDPTGAGDVFNGAFLHGLANGWDPVEAARLGVIMAGLKVRGRGAIQSLPRRDQVYAILRA